MITVFLSPLVSKAPGPLPDHPHDLSLVPLESHLGVFVAKEELISSCGDEDRRERFVSTALNHAYRSARVRKPQRIEDVLLEKCRIRNS
jgi:hypothetical protein